MSTGRPLSAEYFDEWYTDMVASPVKDELVRRHLGLPAHLLSTSLLSWEAVGEVAAALRLSPGQVLADLACGRGGYGLEVAHRSGADLVGVDFSAAAVRQAQEYAVRLGRVARFRVGELTATGLADASVDAVMCIDAVQFAEPADAVYREIRRVLAPAGRVVLTCWEPVDRGDERVPDRLRSVDLRAGLTRAGFVDVTVDERPGWQAVEAALWQEAVALDPGTDPALRALQDEGVRVLEFGHRIRRVIASATAN
ncbi:class I SAM-dependent methyltransferase [Actinoplanes sp. KI2]|uniref:class I SAM-dependent methyltransferase n=1 Tax=Actinoplanes sp. KI2 TaxID=2983315 RepID=UPI0021D56E2E|nr:class I SAM-dependent methyltransferase [Actinoplanes sp. KI2]MCU7729926.1 class I SAM-dependent methyltransferase [Actinoplanes sp. KI2]